MDLLCSPSSGRTKPTKSLSGSTLSDWLTPAQHSNQNQHSSQAKKTKIQWRGNSAECVLKHDNSIKIDVKKSAISYRHYLILNLQNTTTLRTVQQKLANSQQELIRSQQAHSRLAHFDALTQLPNSKHFCQQVNDKITAQSDHFTGAMFIIRISQFKLLNKRYGKNSANRIIQDFTSGLKHKLSNEAIMGRLRGIKFACFVPVGQAYLLQRNLSTLIRSVLPDQVTVKGDTLNMDYQVGIAYYHSDGKNAEELLEHCEMALEYPDKTDCLSYYDPGLERRLLEEHTLGLTLGTAIRNREIEVWLQPQVTPDGQIRSFEALSRWNNNGQFIPPNIFIGIAETLGLLPLLAENMVKELVSTLTYWHEEKVHTPIAFNLAGQELMNDAFFALLMSLVSDNPWLSDMLELEITETSPVMTNPLIHKRLRSLSQYGYSIAIDDFGTGQASLGQLIDIPANILKIDRRFIAPLPDDQRHMDIVKSTMALANSLNMDVIAEGIETKEQADLLVSLGCTILQGYYFAKPSPMSEWTAEGSAKAKTLRMVY
nr:bifunctional diguanylate cyclase/phosphodiesterase [Marinomonas algarum]